MEDKWGGSSWSNRRGSLWLGVALLLLLGSSVVWASPPKLSSLIGQVAQQEGVDPNLLKAVVAVESQFDTVSVSTRGAVGLMQLMPETARELGVSNRFNPEQNLRGGARYLKQMMERYPNSLPMALAAYNAGPNAVSRFGGVPPFPATKRYIHNVLSYFAKTVPGNSNNPKKLYRARKKQDSDPSLVADAHQRVVRLLGDNDEENDDTPSMRSPRPVPSPKAVHSVKNRSKSSTAHTASVNSSTPTHTSRVVPYVAARHISSRYQAKNTLDSSEEIPIVVLRR
ncbi:lytic transglycosylase domain-containing protein [Candidatus Magnetaquicoccus inordinatus]|uniref:lytic transglycosylase domain-containing protein n=1 Tax=Candidatus Magnetaquicoccus inordinatus TaxID=2496818 RepID=UPI001D0E790D|nr:lytic transglycosylase domain-containing protein [Candidatus Magnetaquicoccus inordinatus]